MLVRTFVAIVVLAAPGVLMACSGAESQDVFGEAKGQGQSQNDEQTEISASRPSPSSPSNPAGAAPAAPTTAPSSAPPDGKDAGAPPAPPPPVCTQELEPNNDKTKATLFTTGLCGKIGGMNDVDFGRFVVPQGAKSVTIQHLETGGSVDYRFFLEGKEVDMDQVKALPGATYYVEVSLGGWFLNRPTYELDVSFK